MRQLSTDAKQLQLLSIPWHLFNGTLHMSSSLLECLSVRSDKVLYEGSILGNFSANLLDEQSELSFPSAIEVKRPSMEVAPLLIWPPLLPSSSLMDVTAKHHLMWLSFTKTPIGGTRYDLG
jgi:hypothetical protein